MKNQEKNSDKDLTYGVKYDTCVSMKRLEIKQNVCEAQ
jgi:hypothetical protein